MPTYHRIATLFVEGDTFFLPNRLSFIGQGSGSGRSKEVFHGIGKVTLQFLFFHLHT